MPGNDRVASACGAMMSSSSRMQQRFAAADGHDRRAQPRQVIDALLHGLERHRLGELVVLVAVLAREIAAAHGDDVRHHRMVGGGQSLGDHLQFANAALVRLPRPPRTPGDDFDILSSYLLQHMHAADVKAATACAAKFCGLSGVEAAGGALALWRIVSVIARARASRWQPLRWFIIENSAQQLISLEFPYR